MSFLQRVFYKVGIDATIALTVLTRVIQAGSGVISIFFIARYLNIEEQGYYYTFTSILAIHVFFELGLSGIITQFVAHEFAHLTINAEGVITGDEYYKSRLASLLRFCVKWFAIIAILLFVVLLIAGIHFFTEFHNSQSVEWQKPWVILSLATALNLFIDPLLAYFDGLVEIKDIAKVRLIQKGSFIAILFICFFLGFKLYSSAIASIISILINYVQIIFSKRRLVLTRIWHSLAEWDINYLEEIFPFQWRIALSWISGYFIFQLFNPILFATEGPKVAGQMGMTLQVLSGITVLAMSWFTTKIPLFSSLVAKREFKDLDAIFKRTQKQNLVVTTILLVVFVLGIYLMNLLNLPIAERFIPLFPLCLLTITTIVNQVIFSWSIYLRCYKKEPLVWQSVVVASLCSLSTIFVGKLYGLNGIVLGYSAIICIISLIWVKVIYSTKKVELQNH